MSGKLMASWLLMPHHFSHPLFIALHAIQQKRYPVDTKPWNTTIIYSDSALDFFAWCSLTSIGRTTVSLYVGRVSSHKDKSSGPNFEILIHTSSSLLRNSRMSPPGVNSFLRV